MKIAIKETNLKLGKEIKKKIERKINSLEKFAKEIFEQNYWDGFFGKGKPKAEAWVEVAKSTEHHRKGPFFYAECQIKFPKKTFRAEAEREDIEVAINEVKEELKRQIKEFKNKKRAKFKKGALKLKRRTREI
jgi:ribosomal subunit interface protein